MRIFLLLTLVLLSWSASSEVIFSTTAVYPAKNSQEFEHQLLKETRVCLKIPMLGRTELSGDCAINNGCMVLNDGTENPYNRNRFHDPLISKTYKGTGETLRFKVLNEYESEKDIQVTIFEPNYRVDELIELKPEEQRVYTIKSNTKLFAQLYIPDYDYQALENICGSIGGCLKIEDYSDENQRWYHAASVFGVGKGISPNEDEQIVFRVTNYYRESIKIRVTAADPEPEGCTF